MAMASLRAALFQTVFCFHSSAESLDVDGPGWRTPQHSGLELFLFFKGAADRWTKKRLQAKTVMLVKRSREQEPNDARW